MLTTSIDTYYVGRHHSDDRGTGVVAKSRLPTEAFFIRGPLDTVPQKPGTVNSENAGSLHTQPINASPDLSWQSCLVKV